MKLLPLTLFAGSALIAAAALAADQKFDAADQNGDGLLSMAEVAIAMPGASSEAFDAADGDQSGSLTEDEYIAAVNDGVLPEG